MSVVEAGRTRNHEAAIMADYKKYDARIDSLVMETATEWDSEIGDLSDEDKAWVASAVHQSADQAANVAYVRSHTGFTRIITVTVADIERLYAERIG